MNKKNPETKFENIDQFANLCRMILRSDRDCYIGISGLTGEGKSALASAIAKAYEKCRGREYDYSTMTYSRKQLLEWTEGKGKTHKGRLPLYSVIQADEIYTMFHRRNWYMDDQKDMLTVLNTCRDRHYLLLGAIPNFWELDNSFTHRVRFYAFVFKRGAAWIFQQEVNPFSDDPWNKADNKKMFRKDKGPYRLKNYVTTLYFDDWTPEDKERYYSIRNQRRSMALQDNKQDVERYAKIKAQRDHVIRYLLTSDPEEFTLKKIAEITTLSYEAVRQIKEGII